LPLNFKELRFFRSKNIFSRLWNPLKNSFLSNTIVLAFSWFPLSLTLEMSLTWINWEVTRTLLLLKRFDWIRIFRSLIIFHFWSMSDNMESIDLPTDNPLDGSFLNISLEQTVHTSNYDSYQCDICQKKFKSQHNLKRHLKIHDRTKFFFPSSIQ